MSLAYKLQRTCVASYLAAIGVQVYVMGLALFGVTSFVPHALLGYAMIIGAAILVLLTITARLPVRTRWLAAGVLGLTILQPVLMLVLRHRAPALAALHMVNALAIFGLAVLVALGTRAPAAAREAR